MEVKVSAQWIIVPPANIDKIEQNIKVSSDLLIQWSNNVNKAMD